MSGRNEEGEEHLHQRRRQLPFNLSTGEGVLYNTWMESFSEPDASSITGDSAEGGLDPASVLGSLQRQDRSIYSCAQKASPQRLAPGALDLEPPQWSLEQALWDSHALLSVPGQTQASEERPVTGDLTAEAMIATLEQVMGDIENGGMEGLEIEEAELRGWENTLVRKNNEWQDALKDLNQSLANDVFSYVEEALMRETGGPLQGSAGPAAAHNPQLWPSGCCGPRGGEQVIPSQSCSVLLPDSTQQSWHRPGDHTDSSDQRLQQDLKTSHRPEQLQSFHGPTLTPRSHLPGSLNPTPMLHHPQMQQLPGSCNHGNRGRIGDAGAAVPVGINGTLPGQLLAAHTNPRPPLTLSRAHTAPCTDVDNIGSLDLNGDESGTETAPSDCCYVNASLLSSFDCWQEEALVRGGF